MLKCQKDSFDLDEDITYLNGAYMSPLLNKVRDAGLHALIKKSKPWSIPPTAFFDSVLYLKQLAARVIQTDQPERIAVIPSVSYGMANVARNIKFKKGDHIVLLDKQFPSNYFIWKSLAEKHELILDIVSPPSDSNQRGPSWNEAVLKAITPATKLVTLEHIHWADGTLFDLKAIREKTNEVGALLVVDVTQSLGAFPFDQSVFKVDALVGAAYKFMMGPYAMGVAYYGPAFDHGTPIEENWINKKGSEVFEKLLDYESDYKPGAARYSMGEQSQFIHVPMQIAAFEQLLEWGIDNIQSYCKGIVDTILPSLKENGIWIEEQPWRANHLFGIRPAQGITVSLKEKLLDNHIYVSYRSDTIRISPNVYNSPEDLIKLVSTIIE
ncbi:MAG: aminotransferase class V-fold PLP-dependent enzyme [Saprospiraceae bacterium]